jgi:TonB-linked outer membrane protein, SusC/RagA family/TonB-dependent outer membrane receptor, SusC/RagA subfamily, signature region
MKLKVLFLRLSLHKTSLFFFFILFDIYLSINCLYANDSMNIKTDYITGNWEKEEISQQKKQITGTVVDVKDEPVIGANIIELGATSNGTITDVKGNFSLSVEENAVLRISYIGYVVQDISTVGKTSFNIVLQEDAKSLEEVIVVGYSTQRRKDITGSVAVVDVKYLKSIPSGSALQSLQGQASGVNVISSGVPGGASNIFIRGITSFGDTQPLILIDGVEGSLDDVSANDVESVQILKDAGAAAIYGVRGSNGVILVSTKKGEAGLPIVTYEGYFGMQSPLKGNPFNLLNSEDFARLFNIAFPANQLFVNGMPDYLYTGPGVSGTGMAGDPQVDPSKYNFDPNDPSKNYLIQAVNKTGTNWFDEVFNPAPMQQHNLSVSGGTENAKYMLSLNYLNQQGTLMETYHKRYSARINTSFKTKKGISIGENLYIYTNATPGFLNQSEGSPISHIYRQMPIIPVYDIMGNFGGMFAGPDLGNAMNPVAVQKRTVNNRSNSFTVVGNVFAEAEILKGLTLRTSFGGSSTSFYNINFAFNRYNDREGSTGLNSLTERSGYNHNIIWTNILTYQKDVDNHRIKLLAGSEMNKYRNRSLEGGSTGFFSTDFEYLILSNGTGDSYNYSSAYANNLLSFFGRLDYSFADKYLLSATIRRDGSSRFGPNKRYGTFPSVSLGWRVSGEEFMRNIQFIDDLKIKASYGVLGSQNNVSAENAFSLYGSLPRSSYYDIAGTNTSAVQGFYQTRVGNENTGWEENIVQNIGFDATILDSKLEVSFEFYQKSVNGLLFTQPLPATVGGATSPVVNIGDIRNRGIDIAVTYHGNITTDLNYSIGTNITTYKNEVVSIPDPGYFDVVSSRNGYLVRNQEGHPVSSFFGYDVIGLFNDAGEVSESPTQSGAAPGTFKYRDVVPDGAITPDDRTFIGDPNPAFTYGLNLGLNYKNFDFSSVFYGSQGNDVLNQVKWYTHFFSGFRGGKSNDLLNAWTPENKTTNIPKIDAAGSFSTSGVPNSFYVEDGSFLKLRSLILGYTVKPASLQRFGIHKLRLYLQGANLFTITQYSGLDPELVGSSASFGIDLGNYPNTQKSFILGVNVSF